MTKCWRHFKALSKKNAIVWYRTPFCALTEVLTPALLMLILCVLRINVPSVPTDAEGMLAKKGPVMPGVGYDPELGWYNSTGGNHYVDDYMRPMIGYSDYTRGDTHMTNWTEYSIGYDKYGPQFFTPTHCMKTFDY